MMKSKISIIGIVAIPIIAILIVNPSFTYAQEENAEDIEEQVESLDDQEKEISVEEYEETLEEYEEELSEYDEDVKKGVISLPPMPPMPPIPPILSKSRSSDDSAPRFGVYLDDLHFKDAYEMHYPYNYGVLISGVTRGSNAYRAGLVKGDIIMEFDGEKVRFEDHLIQLRNTKRIGDTVDITFFRNEKIMNTVLTFEAPAPELDIKGKPIKKKKGLSPGYGGGGPEATYIDFDFSGINSFLEKNGFDKVTNGYTVTYGGFGMGNVGKGWFIGGMGAGYQKQQQIPVRDEEDVTIGTRRYQFQTGYGGVTIVKKMVLFTPRIVLDLGMMLGGGGTTIEIGQTDGNYSWTDEIGAGNSYSLKYQKSYFVYRPSVGLLVRIKNWVGIHGSVGYLGTYSPDDTWTAETSASEWLGENTGYLVQGDSPKTPNGLSYSLGFWFGF